MTKGLRRDNPTGTATRGLLAPWRRAAGRLAAAICGLALLLVGGATVAQSPAAPPKAAAPAAKPGPGAAANPVTRPLWSELSAGQREALAPLADHWDRVPIDRKQKWLEVAPKYFALSPEGRQRMHERMVAFVKLTPEQRETTRENFRKASKLPLEQRQALVQQYRELPQEQKEALARRADRRVEPPRRSERDARPAKGAPPPGAAPAPATSPASGAPAVPAPAGGTASTTGG